MDEFARVVQVDRHGSVERNDVTRFFYGKDVTSTLEDLAAESFS